MGSDLRPNPRLARGARGRSGGDALGSETIVNVVLGMLRKPAAEARVLYPAGPHPNRGEHGPADAWYAGSSCVCHKDPNPWDHGGPEAGGGNSEWIPLPRR